jgi:hypothetical protein
MWKVAVHTDAVELAGEWVLLDSQRYVVTKLNEVGGWIWSRLKEGATLEMLVADMTDEYEIESAQARVDIESFVNHLIGCGLVEHVA